MKVAIYLAISALLVASVQSTIICDGVLDSPKVINSDVKVGDSCLIRDVTITGSVDATGGPNFGIEGIVTIYGNVDISSNAPSVLTGKLKIAGTLRVAGPAVHRVGPQATVGRLVVESFAVAYLNGTAGSVFVTDSANLIVYDGTVTNGGITMANGNGMTLYGAVVNGGIKIRDSTGGLSSYAGTRFGSVRGDISIERTTGNVFMSETRNMEGSLRVRDLTGNVGLGDIELVNPLFQNVSGTVDLSAFIRKGLRIFDVAGEVSLRFCSVLGETQVSRAASVVVEKCNFTSNRTTISSVAGSIQITKSTDASLDLFNNRGSVLLEDNDISDVRLFSNVGGVSLINNKFDDLNCVNNVPPPTGSANSIENPAFGQCSAF